MKRGFSIVDHPSDLLIEAHGSSLKEAFEEAARALISIVADITAVRATSTRSVRITGNDYSHLLVQWLSEILYFYDGQQFITGSTSIETLSPTELTASVRGEPFSAERHRPRVDVKAVTYHQIAVREAPGEAAVSVVVDI